MMSRVSSNAYHARRGIGEGVLGELLVLVLIAHSPGAK